MEQSIKKENLKLTNEIAIQQYKSLSSTTLDVENYKRLFSLAKNSQVNPRRRIASDEEMKLIANFYQKH